MSEIEKDIAEEISTQIKDKLSNLIMSSANFTHLEFMLIDLVSEIKDTITTKIDNALSSELNVAKRQLENLISPKITNRLTEFEYQMKNLLECHMEKLTKFNEDTISKFNNVLTPINNIYFIKEKVNVVNKLSAENYVRHKLEQAGFKVVKKNDVAGMPDFAVYKTIGMENDVVEMDYYQLLVREIILNCKRCNRGKPEVKIYSDHPFYVEVKTNGDGLRTNQLEWIKNHPEHKVIVYCLDQTIEGCSK